MELYTLHDLRVAILGHVANDTVSLVLVVERVETVDSTRHSLGLPDALVLAEQHTAVTLGHLGRRDLGVRRFDRSAAKGD